jgi:hypothetical protein
VRVPTLFNLDALFELIIGLALLFNPITGPVLPAPGWLIAIVGIGLLVAACVLGRAGMGKGGLVTKIRMLAAVNAVSGLVAVAWAFVRCEAGGRVFVLIVAAGLLLLSAAQFLVPLTSTKQPAATTRRASVEELQRALRGD